MEEEMARLSETKAEIERQRTELESEKEELKSAKQSGMQPNPSGDTLLLDMDLGELNDVVVTPTNAAKEERKAANSFVPDPSKSDNLAVQFIDWVL